MPENKPYLTKEMHRQIKHLDKARMEQYIKNIYAAGYDAGFKAAQNEKKDEA